MIESGCQQQSGYDYVLRQGCLGGLLVSLFLALLLRTLAVLMVIECDIQQQAPTAAVGWSNHIYILRKYALFIGVVRCCSP